MCGNYSIRLVSEDQLPPDVTWFVAHDGDRCHLFVKHGALTPAVVEQAWAAAAHLERTSPRFQVA